MYAIERDPPFSLLRRPGSAGISLLDVVLEGYLARTCYTGKELMRIMAIMEDGELFGIPVWIIGIGPMDVACKNGVYQHKDIIYWHREYAVVEGNRILPLFTTSREWLEVVEPDDRVLLQTRLL